MSSSAKSENLIDTIDFANGKINEQFILGLKPYNKELKRPAVKNQLLNSPEILSLIAEAKEAAENAAAAEELANPLTPDSTSSELRVQKSNMKTKAVDAGKAIIDPARLRQIIDDFIASSPPPPPPISVSSSSSPPLPPPPSVSSSSSFPAAGLSIVVPPGSSSSSLVSPVSGSPLPLSPLPPPVIMADLINVEKEPDSTRPKIILLNTNEMAFFCYNLFSHDISHDAHPSGLGTKRFNDAILLADESQSDAMSESSLYSGGGKINQQGGYTSITQREITQSINSIIGSVSSELIQNRMLFALETSRMRRGMDTLKKWENKTFIIIDINDIITNYHNGDEHSMYPGYIYFKNKTINPYDIDVTRKGKANSQEPNYTIKFDTDTITFSFRRASPIINNILVNGETYVRMSNIREASTENFNEALTVLGDKFFYEIFTDYMENKSSSKIEGYGSLFPNYYEKKIVPGEGYNPQSFTRFFNVINIEDYPNCYTRYLEYYDYVLDIYIGFIARLPIDKNTIDKIMIYVTTDIEAGNEDEAEEIRNHKNEFINYLAIIFAKQYEKQEENDYIKFQRVLKNFTDEVNKTPEIKQLIDFLTIVNFYFSKEYVSQFLAEEFKGDITPEAGGGLLQKKKLQFGGALSFMKILFDGIDNFTSPIDFKVFTGNSQDYSPEYNSEIYSSGTLIPNKILNFIVNPPVTYDLSNFETLALPYREEIFNISKKNIIRMTNLIDILLSEFSKPNTEISNITQKFSDPKPKNFPIEALILEDTHAVETHLASEADFINYIKSFKLFEQNIFRQIKIAIYYLKTKTGLPQYNAGEKTKFFKNLVKNLNTYKEVIEIIGHILESKPKLSQAQKINGSYMIASAVLSMSHYMKQMTNVHPENSAILTAEINMLSEIFLKKNLLKATTHGDIDDKLINNFVNWLTPGTLNGAGNFVTNTKFLYNEEDLPAKTTLWKSTKIKKPNDKFQYISNAVSASGVGLPEFLCPFSSIVDGQSTCNSYESSIRTGHPVEIGLLNVIVRDGNPVVGGSSTTNETMRYHVRVEKHEDPKKWDVSDKKNKLLPKTIKISAYLKIGNEVIINIGKVGDYIKTINKPYIEVDLNGSSSPLEAAACVKTIMDICINTLHTPDGKYRKWDDYLNFLNTKNATMIVPIPNNPGGTMEKSSRELRNEILSASFVKSLGDYLQELNIVAENGGYVGNIESDPNNGNLARPSDGRFGFSNDRPSGVRLVLLLLFGKTGINNKSFGGYLTEKGHYLIGVRNKNDSMNGGGIRSVKRKTKRKNYNKQTKKKYKKQRKYNKQTKKRRKYKKTKKI
jgi:hypothetical protein